MVFYLNFLNYYFVLLYFTLLNVSHLEEATWPQEGRIININNTFLKKETIRDAFFWNFDFEDPLLPDLSLPFPTP